MLFLPLPSVVLVTFAAVGVTASPAPAPIPPELQPIIAAKNNLGGVAAYDDPKFNSTLSSSSNGVLKSQIPMTYITAASLTAGTVLLSFV
ncbi:hypothetical protein H2248_004925 [Termitomyces sp. 'cryptogamus']|nr:hypothetical protein H2248_004925 [Termitomyces sp. 'cryptogamus']